MDLNTRLYMILGLVHFALVTDAGLLIMVFGPSVFGNQPVPKLISLVFGALYPLCDLIRLFFPRGATISLGFPIIFLTLWADSPLATLLVAVPGSLISEALRSRYFSRQRLSWYPALRRAFFYAGHHAVAGFGALVAFQLVRDQFSPWLVEIVHIQATLIFILTYSLLSMLLIRPHDLQIRLFLAPGEEPFVRVDFLTTLLLVPVPASVFYLYNLDLGQTEKNFIVVGVLPPLFALLFYLARNFARMEEQREQLALGKKINQRLGSPANMAEMVERVLTLVGHLVDYRWGAAYSLVENKLELCGVKPPKGSVIICDPNQAKGIKMSDQHVETFGKEVIWPPQVEPGEGILDQLARDCLEPQFFERGLAPPNLSNPYPSDPYLPEKTALMVLPITTEPRAADKDEFAERIGVVALARPKRRFTTWDWERGLALAGEAGNLLLSVQRLERKMQELYQRVEDYAEDPERVRQAMQELVFQGVDVSRILAVVAERAFQGNVRAVLRDVLAGQRTKEIDLDLNTLTQIFERVRDETPGMPPLNPDILQLLQTVTSCLSLAFSFRYQFPEVERGPAFKEFYEFLLVALDATTVSRIVALDTQIVYTVRAIRQREKDDRCLDNLPSEATEEVRGLRDIIGVLQDYDAAKDLTSQRNLLGQALELLTGHERAVRERLRDPERFVFLQILSGWRAGITNALEDLDRGPAQLCVSLRSHRALPLDEITVGLVLENNGPGVASRVVAALEPSGDYQVLRGKADLGTLTVGKRVEPEFTLRSKGAGSLRLKFRVTSNDPERKGKVREFADMLHLREAPARFTPVPILYTPGVPLKPGSPTFVGREDTFNFIQQNVPGLAQKMILVLIGERRTGKTTILKQLPAQLNGSNLIPVFVDGQKLGIDPGMHNLFLSLMLAIADGLDEAGIPIPRPTPADLGESPQYAFERDFLPMIRERIGERTLLLTMDEFEQLGARVKRGLIPPEVFPYLRHLIQHEEQLAFIFSGTHKIEGLIGDYWSVLFNLAVYKKVGFLKQEDAIRLITEPVQPYGVVYDDLAIDEILRLTACHPYFTQLLCYILVCHCNDVQRNYVTVQDVRNAVRELLETGRAHLTFLWDTSTSGTKLALAALAELQERLDQVTAAAIADRLGAYQMYLDPGQILKTMEQLAARDVIQETPGNPVSYQFTAQLYAHWIRRYKSLSKVVEEVKGEPVRA